MHTNKSTASSLDAWSFEVHEGKKQNRKYTSVSKISKYTISQTHIQQQLIQIKHMFYFYYQHIALTVFNLQVDGKIV